VKDLSLKLARDKGEFAAGHADWKQYATNTRDSATRARLQRK